MKMLFFKFKIRVVFWDYFYEKKKSSVGNRGVAATN